MKQDGSFSDVEPSLDGASPKPFAFILSFEFHYLVTERYRPLLTSLVRKLRERFLKCAQESVQPGDELRFTPDSSTDTESGCA